MTSHKSSMEECFSTSSILIPFTCSSFASSSAIAPVVRRNLHVIAGACGGKFVSKKWLAHIHSSIFMFLETKRGHKNIRRARGTGEMVATSSSLVAPPLKQPSQITNFVCGHQLTVGSKASCAAPRGQVDAFTGSR